MDFITAGGKIHHLHKDEITHELTVRRLTVNPVSRRDSLSRALKQTAALARRGSLKFTSLEPCDIPSELAICQKKAEQIEKELGEDLTEAAAERLISRCQYWLCRLDRIPDSPEVELMKELVTRLKDRVKSDEQTGEGFDSCSDTSSEDTTRLVQKTVIYKTEKTFNVNSLNLKYSGDSCARTFLTRLEELRVARKLSEEVVFRGFPEILEGPALSWFRSNKCKLTSYSVVVEALREDFDIPDLDYQLLQEIRARTQAREETIVVFVSTILGMFERLSKPVPEEEKLDILMRNIRPDYSRELALRDVTSIDQLKKDCKRIELAKIKADQFREPSSSTSGTRRPTLGSRNRFDTDTRRTYKSSPQVAAVDQGASSRACFRCGSDGHPTRTCHVSRDLVCFRCGEKGVRAPECPKCQPPPKN